VVGEARKYLGAIIQVDYDTVGGGARQRWPTPITNPSPASRGARAGRRIVRATNKRFARVENVRRFAILEKELDHDDGELTATKRCAAPDREEIPARTGRSSRSGR